MTIKVLTWNLRRAKHNSRAWNIIANIDADILLLQEVASIPAFIQNYYKVHSKAARSKRGGDQRFSSAILVKGDQICPTQLSSSSECISSELVHFGGNILSCQFNASGCIPINLVTVYSPAWPINSERTTNEELSSIKLTQNTQVFCTELLWDGLRSYQNLKNEFWIVATRFQFFGHFRLYVGKGTARQSRNN
jgi:hypothetical protein